ncbi:MAG: hypothetical protein WKG01_38795 [Kofleriaceae bacterium]
MATDDDGQGVPLPDPLVIDTPRGNEAAADPVVVFTGTQVQAEALTTMLHARGVSAAVTGDHEIEGGTAIVEAVIFVPPDQAEEARALIADTDI